MTISSNTAPTVATALSFLRSELTSLQAYTPHPGGTVAQSVQIEIDLAEPTLCDRVETNESPYDLPPALKQELAQIWTEEIESNRYPDGGHESGDR
jgi:histidinol-phosphate aminotransferase